jgi:hypothetical protein
MNDYLGTVYVHNAMNLKIMLDDFIGFIHFNNGMKDLQISEKDISYVMEGKNKQVLKIAQQFMVDDQGAATTNPICLNAIEKITVLEGFVPPTVEMAEELFME